ncbi:MAG: LamG domain-containing protein [Planctomycetota bacterium]
MKTVLRNNLVACVLVCAVVCLGSVEPASADIFDDANLVGLWQFNGDAKDNSGAGNHGTLYGDADVSEDVLLLDGTGDYVNIGNDSSLKPSLPISVSMWIHPDNVGINQYLLTNDSWCSSCYCGTASYIKTTDQVSISYGDGGTGASWNRRSKTSASTVNSDEWQHIAYVIRGATDMDIYIDANDAGGTYNGTGGAMAYSGGDGYIGGRLGTSFPVDGKMDDVMVYDRALEDWEVRQLYNEGNKAYGYFNKLTVSNTLVLPVKSTTGDPASPVEGQIYVNTADNKIRVYADGEWRDLATW